MVNPDTVIQIDPADCNGHLECPGCGAASSFMVLHHPELGPMVVCRCGHGTVIAWLTPPSDDHEKGEDQAGKPGV